MSEQERKAERERMEAACDLHRGKPVVGMAGKWWQFCCKCLDPIIISHDWLRTKTDLVCEECRPPIAKGGPMSGAFAPDKRT